MKNNLHKINEEIQAKIGEAFSSKDFQEAIAKTKASSDSGTFEVLITTEDVDRAGEVIKADGWDFTNYLASPVVLWGHDYKALPIGICDSLEKVEGNKILAKGRFVPGDVNPFAQQVRKMYDLGLVRAISVGFIPKEMTGNVITKAELLEFSFVSVPANPFALSTLSKSGIEIEEYMAKGIFTKGEVSSELDKEAQMQLKYENCESVFDVMGAFFNVYFDENTTADKFSELLKETVGILQTVAEGTYKPADEGAKGVIAKAIKPTKKDALDAIFKEGRTISKKTRQSIDSAVEGCKGAVVALESLIASTEVEKDLERPTPAATDDIKQAEEALVVKKLFQDMATILTDKLHEVKKVTAK